MGWTAVVDIARGAIFALAHWCGGSVGLAIFVASIATRLMMLPLTLGATRRRLVRERDKVTKPNGRMVIDSFLSLPPAAALYSAVRAVSSKAGRFLWITDLASSDRLLALVGALVAAGAAWFAAAAPAGRGAPSIAPLVVAGAITFLFLSHMSAGFAIYSIANSLIGAAERSIAVKTIDKVRA